MSNKKISEIPEITNSAFSAFGHQYYVMVEKADGTLYKMLANEALKPAESLSSFVFLDGHKKIHTFGSDISTGGVITNTVNLSQHGVPQGATTAIISVKITGGNYPSYSLNFNGVDVIRWHGVGHHWTQQYTVPISNSKLEIKLLAKNVKNTIEIFLNGYG
jgi:hypothetical protein